jgi:iron complex outermembrane receptor protein
MKIAQKSQASLSAAALVTTVALSMVEAAPARAQQAPQQGDDQGILQEVVVSARRSEESVQNIPISITALTPEVMEEQGITNTEELEQFVPNLRIEMGSRAVNADFSIRGVTAAGAGGDPTSNPAVGQYVNGIYVGSRIANVMSILDIERIEVLRGPQGTLFGKNTTAGAVNIVTRRPSAELEGEAMLRTGSHNRRDVRVIANVPLTETVYARLAAGQDKNDGYYKNLLYGTGHHDRNIKAYNASLRWVPTEQWTFDVTASHMNQNENNRGGDCRFVRVVGFQTVHQNNGGGNFEQACRASEAAGRYNFYADERQYVRVRNDSVVGEFEWRSAGAVGFMDELTISGNLGQRDSSYAFTTDVDMTAEPIETRGHFGSSNSPQGNEVFNGELLFNARIGLADVLFGYNYVDSMGFYGNDKNECWSLYASVQGTGQSVTCPGAYGFYFGNNPLNTSGSGPAPFVANVRSWEESHGVFAHAKFNLTDWFRLETGARWTHETREFMNLEGTVTPDGGFRGFTWVLNDDTVSLWGEGKASWSKVTPTASLNFMLPQSLGILDDALFYTLWSRGFQSGGFNTELVVKDIPELAALQIIQPETLDNYEVGFKTTMFGRRLRLNLAVFRMNYKDKQESINIDNADGRFGPQPAIEVIQNAAKVEITGYELEFQARLGMGFGIDGGLAHQEAEYTDYSVFNPESGTFDDLTGNVYNNQPEDTFTGNLTYSVELPIGGTLNARAGVFWQSETDTGATTVSQLAAGERTQCHQPANSSYNARVSWTDSVDKLTVALSGRNLNNETVLDACTLSIATRGVWHPIYQDERTWALEAVYRFH